MIDQAIERVDALDATIDDFLATSSRPQGRLTDLTDEIRATADRWHGMLAAENRPLRVDISERVPPVTTEPARLQQILDVLLDNARLHGAGQILVRIRESHGAAAIDVEDYGSSIGRDDDIFKRGYSSAGRSGLGLALEYQLADDLGGRLLLSARRPHTKFTLLLPGRDPVTFRPANGPT